jgi:hypothetical protein
VRPGTLVVLIALLVALVVFGVFLIGYDFSNDNGRPEPERPSPTFVSP